MAFPPLFSRAVRGPVCWVLMLVVVVTRVAHANQPRFAETAQRRSSKCDCTPSSPAGAESIRPASYLRK